MVVQLYPHQQKAVDQLSNGKILWGGVGTGKSLTAMAYFFTKVCKGVPGDPGSLRTPKDVYVITTAKKRDSLDWEEEAIKFGISPHADASIGSIKLTVDSWNNIEDYLDVSGAFFIFDEQRAIGSGAWSQAFIKIAKRNEWILLSATPGDTWLDYIPVFVANGWYKNRTQFKREHVVYNTYSKFPKVDRYIGTGKLVRYRNQVLVHMPFTRKTVRHCKDVKVDYDVDLFNKVVNDRWHVYENRPLRDVSELFSVMRKVVNSDESRLEKVHHLMTKHPRLIVFYNFDYELEMLRGLGLGSLSTTSDTPSQSTSEPPFNCQRCETSKSGIVGHWTKDDGNGEKFIPCSELDRVDSSRSTGQSSPQFSDSTEYSTKSTSTSTSTSKSSSRSDQKSPSDGFEIAEWNGHRHDPIPTTSRWVYLVQYTAGSEGWNCITTDAMVFYSPTYSYKQHHQAHGRTDRLNTPYEDLWYYHLLSDSLIDKAILRSLRAKKSFNERDLAL